ncbi:MAG TPA: hypothetical protein VHC97_24855 [Thermoanaerobaculia bacterium]|jgi:hypothetical protein|nr:hypothetical protein [Thermoanaerobaculia bacterium]
MFRRTVHRGIAALLLVTFLGVAGARPAAAAPDAGFLGRLAGLWSAVTRGESDTVWNRLTSVFQGRQTPKSPQATTKRGWGIDPNGNAIYIDTDEPAPTNPGGNS